MTKMLEVGLNTAITKQEKNPLEALQSSKASRWRVLILGRRALWIFVQVSSWVSHFKASKPCGETFRSTSRILTYLTLSDFCTEKSNLGVPQIL